jgi:transposase, IS30 family
MPPAIHRKLVKHPLVKTAVIDRLREGWSPEQIAGRMEHEHHPVRVSHETIYRYTYSKDGRCEELHRHLPQHRCHHRPRGGRKPDGLRFGAENSIAHDISIWCATLRI